MNGPESADAPAGTGADAKQRVDDEHGNGHVGRRFQRTRPRWKPRAAGQALDLFRYLIRTPPPVSSPARHVLIALADYADGNGVCRVKNRTLEHATGYSERTIRNARGELREAGHLEWDEYLRPKAGGQGAHTYRLSPALLEAALEAARAAGDAGRAPTSPAGDAALAWSEDSEARQDLPGGKGGETCRAEPIAGTGKQQQREPDGFRELLAGIPLLGDERLEALRAFQTDGRAGLEAVVASVRERDRAGELRKSPAAILAKRIHDRDHLRLDVLQSANPDAQRTAKAEEWVRNVAWRLPREDFLALLAERQLPAEEAERLTELRDTHASAE